MEHNLISMEIDALFQFARLHGWCIQTDNMIDELYRKFRLFTDNEKCVFTKTALVKFESDMSQEERIVALVLLWKSGEKPARIMDLIYWKFLGNLSQQNYLFMIRNFFVRAYPIPNDIAYDLTQRKFISYRSAILYAMGIEYFDSELDPENTLLYFICLLCRKDLNEQNRAIICYLLSRIDIDMPAGIYTDILATVRRLKDVINDVEQRKEKVLTEELLMSEEPDFGDIFSRDRHEGAKQNGYVLSGYDREREYKKTANNTHRERSYTISSVKSATGVTGQQGRERSSGLTGRRSGEKTIGEQLSVIGRKSRAAGRQLMSAFLAGIRKLAEKAVAAGAFFSGKVKDKSGPVYAGPPKQETEEKERSGSLAGPDYSVKHPRQVSDFPLPEKAALYRISFTRMPKDILKLMDLYKSAAPAAKKDEKTAKTGKLSIQRYRRIFRRIVPVISAGALLLLLFFLLLLLLPVQSGTHGKEAAPKGPSEQDNKEIHTDRNDRNIPENRENPDYRDSADTAENPDTGKIAYAPSDQPSVPAARDATYRNLAVTDEAILTTQSSTVNPVPVSNPVFVRSENEVFWIPRAGESISGLFMYFRQVENADTALEVLFPVKDWDEFLETILRLNPDITNPHLILKEKPLVLHIYGE
ncbi:MAG: hypothetical protein JW874_14865 [Spirochaetales bacterium]|nr:hypothetical protein [Spirochaetales bacterium]